MNIIKEVKEKIKQFILKVNLDNEFRKKLDKETYTDLQILIKLWNLKFNDLKHFLNIEKYHNRLNNVLNEDLLKLWKNYLNEYEYIKSLKVYSFIEVMPTKRELIRFNKFINFIKSEFPKWKIRYEINIDIEFNKLLRVSINQTTIPIKFDYSLGKIKSLISDVIKEPINATFNCFACNELKKYKFKYDCCIKSMCLDCHITLMLKNKGLMICPKCKGKEGVKISDEMLTIFVGKMLDGYHNNLVKINKWSEDEIIIDKVKKLNILFQNTVKFKYNHGKISAYNNKLNFNLPTNVSYEEAIHLVNLNTYN